MLRIYDHKDNDHNETLDNNNVIKFFIFSSDDKIERVKKPTAVTLLWLVTTAKRSVKPSQMWFYRE